MAGVAEEAEKRARLETSNPRDAQVKSAQDVNLVAHGGDVSIDGTVATNPPHYQSLNREGRWGTTDDFETSFLHF